MLPARSIVVLAANPCPCGNYHPDARDDRCTCKEVLRRDYRRKVTGPITDRIDITRHLTVATPTAASRPAGRPRVDRSGPGPGRGGPSTAGRPLRRPGVAAQRRMRPEPALTRGWPMTPDAASLVDAGSSRAG